MIAEDSQQLPVTDSWDTYWQGASTSSAFTGGGSGHPQVLSFWNGYFRDLRTRRAEPAIVDVGSGNGAVADCAQLAFGDRLPAFACVDVSESAIRMLQERFPWVKGVVADAVDIPLASDSYDVATSQFGVEYAGLAALGEISRLVAAGGELVLLLHHRSGSIYAQCAASGDAIRQMQEAGFIPACAAMFEAGFAALQGGDRNEYTAAGKRFAPALRAMESIIAQYGQDVADGTILRIYRDVRTIHTRMQHYDSADVLAWLGRMNDEIDAYAGRMASMCSAAVDEKTFDRIIADLRAGQFEILRAAPLQDPAATRPLAWSLIARKQVSATNATSD